MPFVIPSLLALTLAATLAGCGGDTGSKSPPALQPQQASVIATIDRLQAAARRGEGERICAQIFTRRLAESIEGAARGSCARTIGRSLFSPNMTLTVGRSIRLDGNRAVANVSEQDGTVSTLSLVEQGGDWRIDSVTPAHRGGR